MALGRKTGGRNFTKGQGGRKRGAKDKVPRGLKVRLEGSVKAIYDALIREEPQLFIDAIRRGLRTRGGQTAFHHVQQAAHYLDGKPLQMYELQGKGGGPIQLEDVGAVKSSLEKKLDTLLRRAQASDPKKNPGEGS